MTDRDAMLRCILESPDQDFPRLVFADWLDENGESERASFIRCQIELARRRNLMCGRCEKFLDRYAMMTPHCRGDVCSLRRREYESSKRHIVWDWIDRTSLPSTPFFNTDDWHRGFPRSLTLSWSEWLARESKLYWHPGQMVVCAQCQRVGHTTGCTHRIPRPFVATAQPLERVRLTTWPDVRSQFGNRDGGRTGDVQWLTAHGTGDQFDRVKCPTCADWKSGNHCRDCTLRGTPLNEWRCDKWPTITFAMPEAEYRDYATADFTTRFGIPPELIGAREEMDHG